MIDEDVAPEFSRPIPVPTLSGVEKTYAIEAIESERLALAERFGILGVDTLSATVRLKIMSGGEIVRLRGKFQATVRQACVITLEPVAATLAEEFELLYGPQPDAGEGEIVLDLEVEDPPEPIVDGIIDIGEAVAEHLALALDPFPRAPGAVFQSAEEPLEEPVKRNPFAALEALKKK
jgi:uncharacterized metal-binding protein YceD (DUF177 family)